MTYGYSMVDGGVVVNEEEAANIRKICENYLNGMTLTGAAQDVGLKMNHCGVKRIMQNKRYLGDDFYPAILTDDLFNKVNAERVRREKALGRDKLTHKAATPAIIYTRFSMPQVRKKYKDPVLQAEYSYSLIKRSK